MRWAGIGLRLAGASVLALLCSQPAYAQFSGKLEWLSDRRLRGVSQSEQRPAWQVSCNVELGAGWFAGALLSTDRISARASGVSAQVDAGYARQMGPNWSWELGLAAYQVRPDEYAERYRYVEGFGGLSGDAWNARLYLSGHHEGGSAASVYAEFNRGLALADHLSAGLHAGLLHVAGSAGHARQALTRTDLRAGLDYSWSGLVFGVAVVTTLPARKRCEPDASRCGPAAVASVSTGF